MVVYIYAYMYAHNFMKCWCSPKILFGIISFSQPLITFKYTLLSLLVRFSFGSQDVLMEVVRLLWAKVDSLKGGADRVATLESNVRITRERLTDIYIYIYIYIEIDDSLSAVSFPTGVFVHLQPCSRSPFLFLFRSLCFPDLHFGLHQMAQLREELEHANSEMSALAIKHERDLRKLEQEKKILADTIAGQKSLLRYRDSTAFINETQVRES